MKTKLMVAGAIFLTGAAAASAQEACTSYTVQAGDSLSAISRTAYGTISFQQIWDANRAVIGSNPNAISVGMRLELPCLDGTLASATDAAPTQRTPSTNTSGDKVNIHLITGNDYKPFTDESMDGGGVVTQLVRNALATVQDDADTQITFINDWGSHMEVLLPTGAFDGTFPWVLPNCEAATLTADMQARCDNYRFADPVYEIVTGMFTLNGNPLGTTTSAADFSGKNVCVPEGYSAIVLAAAGVDADSVNYVSPATPEACFDALLAGTVDAVELEQAQAADIVTRLGLDDQIAVNDQVSSVSVLTVYVHKNNPDGDAILEAINTGLENIRSNGVWFRTVQDGFRAYYNE
ncbi:amino acid ABC transporter substrate-binding protein, PAAT family [Yoonia rosea]|uniref:Amino acid ABC transporter substrate-binding protein, PAAT family n=1 Tax=Yoonia rosea TaxID=287098 RepID=A0A1R3WQ27_9RHOB|nr:transporter substrate-binding domain-containing protein [Yoonia rosea]SIT79586.1 amino acid ABC transporter substrate-binding protein, PAAT family [Yoonia rosea]